MKRKLVSNDLKFNSFLLLQGKNCGGKHHISNVNGKGKWTKKIGLCKLSLPVEWNVINVDNITKILSNNMEKNVSS